MQKYIDAKEEVVWVPNAGNGGDALIALGTADFFEKIGLRYVIGDKQIIYENRVLLFGGGGNIIGIYKDGETFVTNNIPHNTVIILPHTIKDVNAMIQMFKKSDIIITRDMESYKYVKRIIPYKENVYVTNDMAFYINLSKMPKRVKGTGSLNFFRTDVEKKAGDKDPENNKDLSKLINYDHTQRDMTKVFKTAYEFLGEINKYEVINTSRLHGSIGAFLMGKKVNLYDNSYGKNKAVYQYSLSKYSDIKFID